MTAILGNKRSVLAMLLVLILLMSPLLDASVSVTSADANPYVLYEGEQVTDVTLPQDGKICLKAVSPADERPGFGWQIRDPQGEDDWVDITGAQSRYLWVTYALVGSMLEADGSALLRCRLTDGEKTTYTDAVRVTVSFAPLSESTVSDSSAESQPKKMMMKSAKTTADKGEEEYINHSIIINYLFDNNALAYEPYGATVARGSDIHITVPSPPVVGYKPYRRVGEDYVEADEVVLDYTNIQEDIVINVVYEPALVKFSVHHHFQNLLDDDYSVHADRTTTSYALTGTVVGDGLALTEEELPGFRALAYEKLPVAADGTTIIEIRYDRNYYLVDFDMNGGYGTEPVYTRYGATVGANTPTRHGYVFNGWELVSYDGRTPTAEEATLHTMTEGGTITVPAANLRYRARWITRQTTYTMVFWKENAENNEYSYWGYLDKLTAMSGSFVSAQDWISRVSSITDEAYFTFNGQRSDKDVLVEGDGSTVVNVYYTRKYYKLNFVAKGKCSIPEKHTHTETCYDEICGGGHEHTEACTAHLICTLDEHTVHTEACIACGKQNHTHGVQCNCRVEDHTHTVACWNVTGNPVSRPSGAPYNPQHAQVYRRTSRNYYIYLFGAWYSYSNTGASNGTVVDPDCGYGDHVHGVDCDCTVEEHTHDDSCYGDEFHTHTEPCYRYDCGKQTHTHTDACYRLKCGITVGHTHTSTCNSSTSNSTVKTVYRKYEQSLADLWPVKDDNGKVYNSGERWKPSNSTYYSQVLVYIDKMPPDDFTLTLDEAKYDTFIMHYYLQVLPGQSYDVEKDGKQYKEEYVIKANYNYLTRDEDFFEIYGFNRYDSNPKFSNDQIDINGGGDVNFYYDRTTNNPLSFSNNGEILAEETVSEVMYQLPLKEYYIEPPYPSTLEPNAYAFAGWYTSPGCFTGTEVNWDTIVMENGGLQLYAKWAPITHRVRVFKDATLAEQIGTDQIVAHKAFAHAPEGTVENGDMVFQGWFYMDNVGGQLVKKAFVFTGIPILDDMDIFAEWSSHVEVDYRINYVLKKDGTPIADPTEGTSLAGHNKTFEAKAGTDLYAGYQSGYYPLTNSHTITMSVDGVREFTFEYVYVESVPYKVRYVDEATGKELLTEKKVMDNNLSVVTEVFGRVEGRMPDAYQKRLVLVGEGEDADKDGVIDANVITFYYHTDELRAYYRVVHYIRNIGGSDYREYRSEETVGNIGDTYTVEAMTLTGFTFDRAKTRVNGVLTPVSGTSISAKLPAEGMLIELYYERNTVSYTVRYLDVVTRQEIAPTKTGSGVFGEQAVEQAKDLRSMGYDSTGEQVRVLTLSANPEHNVMEFFYQEQVVSLKYQLVGPAGCGTLSFFSENVNAISGESAGSTPMIAPGFVFVGWYTDAACTVPVDAAQVDAATQHFVPVKSGSIWKTATYYAKVIALKTDLTIRVQSTDSVDAPQAFLFRIVGKAGTETANIDLTVTVMGDGETTVTDLPTGDYTITEVTAWSWRYHNAQAKRELALEYNESGHTIAYDNSRVKGKWLDGNADRVNVFDAR